MQACMVIGLALIGRGWTQGEPLTPVPQTGHEWGITTLAFAPTGEYIASIAPDATAIVWDVRSGDQLCRVKTSSGSRKQGLAFSPDGQRFAVSLPDGAAIRRTTDGAIVARMADADHGAQALGFSPDGRYLAGSPRRVWDAATGEVAYTLEGSWPTAIQYSPDGQHIMAGDERGRVTVRDSRNGDVVWSEQAHGGGVTALAFADRGASCLSWGPRSPVLRWETETGIGRVVHLDEPLPFRAEFSADGSLIAGAVDKQGTFVWEVSNGSIVHRFPPYGRSGATSLAFSRAGDVLAVGHFRIINLWDLGTGEALPPLRCRTQPVHRVAVDAQGRRIATGADDGAVVIWDAATGRQLHLLQGHSDSVYGLVFSPDGQLLASASRDSTVRVWDVPDGRLVSVLPCRDEFYVDCVAFSPDGALLASAGGHRVMLWDVATSTSTYSSDEVGRNTETLRFLDDGRRLLAVGYSHSGGTSPSFPGPAMGRITVWDLAAREVLWTEEKIGSWGDSLRTLTPDGRQFVLRSHWTTRTWDLETGERTEAPGIETPRGKFRGASPDGNLLAIAREDDSIALLDAAALEELLVLPGHFGDVYDAAFAPDGGRLVSASWDGTTRVWELETGELMLALWSIAEVDEDDERHYTGEWIAWTPPGYYVCSDGAQQHLRFRDGEGRLHTAEEYPHLQNPDRVREALAP